MFYKTIVFSLFCFLSLIPARVLSNINTPDKLVISGYISDIKTGEVLVGATVYVLELQTGTASNRYGFYSLSLDPGDYLLVYSYMGYSSVEMRVYLSSNQEINIELVLQKQELDEVVVSTRKKNENIVRPQMSVTRLQTRFIRKIPALMGEVDIIKAIQLLPGVSATSEGSSGFIVRGGSSDQNLILLDEAIVYNASHFVGFFSVFNSDAVQDIQLFKGDLPARLGGRISSVLEVRMKKGNSKEFAGSGGIGLVSSRLTLEGPILKESTSFIVSGRRTYFDLFLPLAKNEDVRDNKLYFYDLNLKLNHRFNENNHLFLSGYFGRDLFKNQFAGMGFGNQTFTLRWNHLFSPALFSNFMITSSRYDYELGTPEGEANSFLWESDMLDYNIKTDFIWYLSPEHTFRFGLSSIYHTLNPGSAKGLGDQSLFTEYTVPKNFAFEHGAYLSGEHKIAGKLIVKAGFRFSVFQNIGKGTVYHFDNNHEAIDSAVYPSGEIFNTYAGIEPRLGLTWVINENSSIKSSYSRNRQYLQLARNSTSGTPLDLWFPASPNIKPQFSNQFAVGYFRDFLDHTFEVSIETYYKKMNNTIDFKDHAELLLNRKLEGEIRVGSSRAYGLEFMVTMNREKLNGWISYSLSRSERTIPEINFGKTYLSPYDKTHDISVVLNYRITKRLDLSANWVYYTGLPATFPTGRYEIAGVISPVYSDRNDYRMPDYHRLDLSLTLSGKEKPERKWVSEWNLSVYNVYSRKNTWSINFVQEAGDPYKTYAEMVYLFKVIPSITYNFKF